MVCCGGGGMRSTTLGAVRVLADCTVLFTGVVHHNEQPRENQTWKQAVQLGATVVESVCRGWILGEGRGSGEG